METMSFYSINLQKENQELEKILNSVQHKPPKSQGDLLLFSTPGPH